MTIILNIENNNYISSTLEEMHIYNEIKKDNLIISMN